MSPHFAHPSRTSDFELFDRSPPAAEIIELLPRGVRPKDDRKPSELGWQAFAEWRPPCFGRLALEYATRFGLSVLPLLVEGSAPALGVVPRGAADASRDPDAIHAWWTQAPRANVGIACGPSGLVVLEIDPHGGGPETLAMHALRLGPLPDTWTAQTPTGWTQYFFSHADGEAAALDRLRYLGPGVRITHRGYVLAPPSVVQGQRGAWHLDARPGRAPLAAMPGAWMDRLTGRTLPPHGLSGLDARHSILGRAFEALGWLGRMLEDGRRIARCPWAHEHTWPGGDGGDGATVLESPESEPRSGRFLCQHPECAQRSEADVLDILPDEALLEARSALPGTELRRVLDLDVHLTMTADQVREAQPALAAFEALVRSGPAPANDALPPEGA